eukprot:10312612-Alexandrium_andersonii.AAC.1
MSAGSPEQPPGLGQPAKRSRSAGAAVRTSPSTASSSAAPSATTAPTSLGPSGEVGVGRRPPEGSSRQPDPAVP